MESAGLSDSFTDSEIASVLEEVAANAPLSKPTGVLSERNTRKNSSVVSAKVLPPLPSFLKSQKGKKKLTWKGYVYNLDRKKPGKHFWKCEKRRVCTGRVICSEGVVELSKMHTHPPDITRIKRLKIREEVRDEVLSTDDPKNSTKILENVMKKVSSDISKVMSAEKMRNTIRYVRKKRLQKSSSADLASCADEKSDDEMEFRLPKVPQVPKSAAKKSRFPPVPRQIRGKNVSDKENQKNIKEKEENVETIEKEVEEVELKDTENGPPPPPVPLNPISEKLRQQLENDFTPKLKELRDRILEKVEHMMVEFEGNFFNYILSVTEDSATLLLDRYQSPNNTTINSENDNDDSEEDSESSNEELEDGKAIIEEEESEDSKSEDEDENCENSTVVNHSAPLKGKGRGRGRPPTKSKENLKPSTSVTARTTRSSSKISQPVISTDSPNTRKRKPQLPPTSYDYDSTDEANLPHNRESVPKPKMLPRKLKTTISAGESSPKKKRKVSSAVRKISAQKPEVSSSIISLNSSAEDSLLPTTEGDGNTLLSNVSIDDIKMENTSNSSSCLEESQENTDDDSQILQETNPSINVVELSSIVGNECNLHPSVVNSIAE